MVHAAGPDGISVLSKGATHDAYPVYLHPLHVLDPGFKLAPFIGGRWRDQRGKGRSRWAVGWAMGWAIGVGDAWWSVWLMVVGCVMLLDA